MSIPMSTVYCDCDVCQIDTLDRPTNEGKVEITTTEMELIDQSQVVAWRTEEKTVMIVIIMKMIFIAAATDLHTIALS